MPSGSALAKYVYLIAHSWKMMVPAVIYLVMNILGFVALGHLDASTFSIVAQMKVLRPGKIASLDTWLTCLLTKQPRLCHQCPPGTHLVQR